MRYPLQLTFKLVAVNPQAAVTDADGALVFYVKQQAFRLKEDVRVFADREQTRLLFTLRADRMLDLNVTYTVTDAAGRPFGMIRREGLRSLWHTRLSVHDPDGAAVLELAEDNPWIKVLDGLLGEIPILGALSGYVLHPSYTAALPGGAPALRLTKQPAFWEGRFQVDRLAELPPETELRGLLALLMLVLLERSRG